MSCENVFNNVIYSYSRAQAIADGVLVDLSQFEGFRQHWKAHLAATSAVWSIIEEALKKESQDVDGIGHDVSTLAKVAIRSTTESNPQEIRFEVLIAGKKHALKLHIGSGDRAEPVLTLMLPYED
jgi:hypothetical protein